MTINPQWRRWLIQEVPAIIFSIMAATLLWYFNQLENTVEKNFRMKPQLRISDQMIPLKPPEYVTVKVKGEIEKLDNIEPRYISVIVDFSNQNEEGTAEGLVNVEIPDYFEGLEVTVSPAYLQVTLEKKITRAVKVKVNTKGAIKAGYKLDIGVPAPDEVLVTGARSEMESLLSLETEVVDMEKLTNRIKPGSHLVTLDQMVRLRPIQSGFSSLTFDRKIEILYSIRIQELVKQRIFGNLYINQVDADNRFDYQLENQYSQLTLSGPELLVNRIPINDLILMVDLGGISEPGEYLLPINRDFEQEVRDQMKGITDLGLEPTEVKVVVMLK